MAVRLRTKQAAPLLVVSLLTACGSSKACVTVPTNLPSDALVTTKNAPEYIGMTLAQATSLVTQRGGMLAIEGQDGKCFTVTADLRPGRVDVDVRDGKVIAAVVEINPVEPK